MGTIANSRTLLRCYSNLGVTVGSERSSSWVDSCGSYPVITYKLQSIDIGNTVIWLHFFFRVGFIRIESLLRRTDFYPNYIKRDWKLFFGLTRMSSDFGMNRKKSDWFRMNFNPKLLPGTSHSSSSLWMIPNSSPPSVTLPEKLSNWQGNRAKCSPLPNFDKTFQVVLEWLKTLDTYFFLLRATPIL